jgi:hypothetical protein
MVNHSRRALNKATRRTVISIEACEGHGRRGIREPIIVLKFDALTAFAAEETP